MAAGLGFKTFNTGDVLSAADVNGYLMQGVLVFADATARDAAITSPQEGQFAFTKNNDSLWYYNGSAWVASGATGDIEGVTAGVGISGGGTSGTVTITNSMATAIDAKGDLVVGTGADTFSKLTVGANGTILTADSAEATGLKWATASSSSPASASAFLATEQTTTSTTYTDLSTVTSVTLTTGTKALVILSSRLRSYDGEADVYCSYAVSGSTSISASDATAMWRYGSVNMRFSIVDRVSTLTAGSNTFTMKFKTNGKLAAVDRQITVIDLGS